MVKYTYNYNCLTDYCNEYNIQLNKDYSNINITRDSYIEGFCITDNCNLLFDKTFRQLKKSGAYCKLCSTKIKNNKFKQTCLKKYGCEYTLQVKEIRELCSKTIKEKYGVDNISQNTEIKKKKTQTYMNNFGVDSSFKSNDVKNKIKNSFMKRYGVENPFQSEEIKQQIINTNLIKYGYENPQQNLEISKKTKQTTLKKYGVESILLLPHIIEKRKQACLNKYGTNYPFQSEEYQNKFKKTCLQKYGFENPQQNSEIADKASKNSYKRKTYICPSGKEILCQGYEPFALDKLLKYDLIEENDIITGCKNVPAIWYNDENNKKHRHYVDIFIPSQNRCIEVKSTWTADKKKDNIYLKQIVAKELGYNYEIWIYNNKKQLVEVKL